MWCSKWNVHGGWTYSGYTRDNYPAKASSKSWWIGFDTAHWGDAKDIELIKTFGDAETIKSFIEIAELFSKFGAVRTTEYVENELIEATKKLKRLNKLREIAIDMILKAEANIEKGQNNEKIHFSVSFFYVFNRIINHSFF